MRWGTATAVALWVFAASTTIPPAEAHTYSYTCPFPFGTTPYPDQADTGLFSLIEQIAPGVVPSGLLYCHVPGVQGGDSFVVTVDPDDPMVIGFSDECPGPDWSPQGLLDGRNSPDDVWLLCNNPDVEIRFTGGEYNPGPGDEAGTVPGDGDAVITLYGGAPGTTVTYSEW